MSRTNMKTQEKEFNFGTGKIRCLTISMRTFRQHLRQAFEIVGGFRKLVILRSGRPIAVLIGMSEFKRINRHYHSMVQSQTPDWFNLAIRKYEELE